MEPDSRAIAPRPEWAESASRAGACGRGRYQAYNEGRPSPHHAMHELTPAIRRLRAAPGRAAATALALALGIGAATAAFAALDGVLLRNLPVERQDELVVAWHVSPTRGALRVPFRAAPYDAVARGAASLEEVAAYSAWGPLPVPVGGPDGPSALARVTVAGDFFGVLGARPAAGRLLEAADDRVGAPPVAVLSYDVWRGRFGADSAVVGSTLRLDDTAVTVVGVAPAGLDFPQGTEIWTPIRGDYGNWPETGPQNDVELHLLGRMAPGVDPPTVAADLTATLMDSATPLGATDGSAPLPVVRTLEDELIGPARPVVRAAFAAAVVLLLAATANAVLFLLAGGRSTTRSVAIQRALGAGRRRAVRRIAADAVVVGVLGTVGAWGLSTLCLSVLAPMAPPELARLDASLGFRPFLFCLAVGLASTAAIAGVAGLALTGPEPATVLSGGARGDGRGPGGARLRRGVAGLQVGLAVVSAVGAGLLGRTVLAMNRIDPGLSADDLTVVSLRVPYNWMAVPPSYLDALSAVVRDLESRAGVVATRPSLGPPLEQRLEVVVTAEGQDEDAARQNPYVAIDAVLPGHLAATGIPLLAGRDLTAADDRPDADPVVVVDQVLADALWPGEDPIGKRINGFGHFDTWFTVVGLAAGTRYRAVLEPHPRAYYPLHRLANAPPSALLVRTSGLAPDVVARLARESLGRADASVRVLGARPMTEVLRAPTAARRFAASVVGSFAAATLLLAALAVFGAFSVVVQERTRELGVRRALGARRAAIVRLVLGATLRVAGAGAALGVVVALWARRLVESLLYGVDATDPLTLVAVVAVCLALAMLAGLVPALRASATDPAISLRSE